MPNKSNPVGPTGQRVAATVRDLRESARLTKTDLAQRLEELGRPLSLDVLTKIENASRSVDVDDLICLALALEVTPLRLMFGEEGPTEIAITEQWSAPVARARLWVQGRTDVTDDSAAVAEWRDATDADRAIREMTARLHEMVTRRDPQYREPADLEGIRRQASERGSDDGAH